MPTFSPPVFAGSAGLKPLYDTTPTAPVTGIAPSIRSAQTELQRRKRQLLGLNDPASPLRMADSATSRELLDLSNPSNGLYSASTQARRSLIDALGQQTQQQRNLYGTVGGMIMQRQGEAQRLIDATNDTQDLVAVAQARGHRNAVNRLRDAAGIARPIEIDVPQGTTGLPVGVEASLRPNAAYIEEDNRDAETLRTLKLAALRNELDLTGTNIADIRRAGDLADLNLSEARAGATYRNKLSGLELADAIDAATYGRDVAQLDYADANDVPFGMERWVNPRDPEDVRIVTPAQKDRLDYEYQTSVGYERIPTQYSLNRQRTQYGTQQEGEGSVLAAQSDRQLLDQYSQISPPGATGPTAAQIRAELIRRYMQKGRTQAQAEALADQIISAEMQQRRDELARQAAKQAGSAADNAVADALKKLMGG